MKTAHHIVLAAVPPTQMLDVSGPADVFAVANALAHERGEPPPYRITLAAPHVGLIDTTSGIGLHASHRLDDPTLKPDTLLVAGGPGARDLKLDDHLLTAMRRLAGRASRVGSVCCGAFLLAAAGLLDGSRVTTHWSLVGDFSRRFPGIDVDGDALFVVSGKVHTAAGISAGIDYALFLVEQDLGRLHALDVARELVVFLKRPGGQAQFSAELATQTATAAQARFAKLQSWICAHVDADLRVPRLAERMAMSPRNFTRRFTDAIGVAPSLYVQRARIDAARRMLSEGRSPLERVAQRCGFSSVEAMRLTFLRHLAVTPQDFRARFSSANDGLP